MADQAPQARQKRVFVNDVDGYSSKYIAQFLAECKAGDSSVDEGKEMAGYEAAFQLVGTVLSKEKPKEKLAFLSQKLVSPSRDELLQCLLECDVVVYNTSESATQQQVEEASWAITALHAESENFKSRKMFILISSVMTWARSKPPNPDDPDALLTEEDFIKRKPHPNFKNHKNLEKLVRKLTRGKKSKLKGYVVASGLQYGKGENLFHFFFKVSWLMQFPKVPIFGQGTNHIPTIHVDDLAGVIQNIVEVQPDSKYILGIDDSRNTLKNIVQKISDVLGPEQIDILSGQEAVTLSTFKPEELECLNIDLRLDACVIRDYLSVSWKYESGIVENMELIVEEYKNIRQLLPITMCMVGPPAVGKTTLAKKISRYYKIHHLKIEEIIEEKMSHLREVISTAELDSTKAAAQEQLTKIENSFEENKGQLGDNMVMEIFLQKLNSKPCKNQGFVLDGFPRSFEEAKKILVDHVIALEAADDFLIKRVQGLPEGVAEDMRYTQDEFLSRLKGYRELSGAEDTVLTYYDEQEIDPEHIEVNTDDPDYTDIMKKIKEIVGVPKNYGLSPEEQQEEDRKKEERRMKKQAKEAAESNRRKQAELAGIRAKCEEWKQMLKMKEQKEEWQEAEALLLTDYLVKYVFPSVKEAMVACSNDKPEDPVDYVAEYLLWMCQQEEDEQQ